jgi:hypothetical protein
VKKGFLPGPDAQAGALLDMPGLAVAVASPRYLFAMKVFPARVDRDVDDLRTLYHFRMDRSLLLGRVARSLWIVGFLSACPVHQRWSPAHIERYDGLDVITIQVTTA